MSAHRCILLTGEIVVEVQSEHARSCRIPSAGRCRVWALRRLRSRRLHLVRARRCATAGGAGIAQHPGTYDALNPQGTSTPSSSTPPSSTPPSTPPSSLSPYVGNISFRKVSRKASILKSKCAGPQSLDWTMNQADRTPHGSGLTPLHTVYPSCSLVRRVAKQGALIK